MCDDLTVIVLTYNEEKNIGEVLNSVRNVSGKVFVVDSFSTDRTVEIATEMGAVVRTHAFENYSRQRNWAQEHNPFETGWVLHLDADEPITPELERWLNEEFENEKSGSDGFMFSRKTYFLGRWIRHGDQYPNFHLRLFKSALGRCEHKAYDQHFVVDGNVSRVPGADIVNTVAANLDDFINAHNRWATKEAVEILTEKAKGDVRARLFGNPIERKRWLKQNIFEKAPLFARSFTYFFYRYVVRLGFLDGKEGLIFFVLQSFWFRFLIDAKVFAVRQSVRRGKSLKTSLYDCLGVDLDASR